MAKHGETLRRRFEIAHWNAAQQVAGNASEQIVAAHETGRNRLFQMDLFDRKLGQGASFLALSTMPREKYARLVGDALEQNHGIKAFIHSVYSYGGDSTSEDVGTKIVVQREDPAARPEYNHAAGSRIQGRLVEDVLDILYPVDYSPPNRYSQTGEEDK